MKYVNTPILIFILVGFIMACNSPATNPEDHTNMATELRQAKVIIDSLDQKIASLEAENLQLIKKGSKAKTPPPSKDEAAVQEMVINLKKAFNNINQDPDEILQFFLSSFSTNQVSVNIDNEAEIAIFSADDFKAYLKKEMRKKGMSVDMGEITFLDTRIKGEIFTATFRNTTKVYNRNQLIYNRAIVSTITGRNQDGWKIGNYSWVAIDYAIK